jgi:hypothetical protein
MKAYNQSVKKIILSGFLFFSFFAFGENASASYPTVNILPLGDSITENAPTKSYRYYLWFTLKSNRYDVNFVGSKKTQVYENFDHDHEGRSGWRADEIAVGLPSWLKTYTPDVVLLHIGHNDFFQNESVENVVFDIENIINILQSNNRNVTILLAQIIPAKGSPTLKRQELNALIPGIAREKTTSTSKIYPVDHWTGYDPDAFNYDNHHPNELGNEKIADNWFATLKIAMTKFLSDLNGDRKVDIFDYSIFISNFGKTGSNLASDLNKDGKVDIFDYSIFAGNFGSTN